jgi:uncharacterized protein (DUF1697 family)
MSTSYIAFLRGINVGGHLVKMERLRDLFAQVGVTNVRSYINSGNIFFDTAEKDRKVLADTIEQHLHSTLSYEVPVFLRTTAELEAILMQNPFKDIELTEDKRFCVLFTDEPLNEKLDFPIHSSKNDMDLVAVNRYEAFVTWHIINGRPPSGKFPKDILPARNTSRFFHTLGKIFQAAQA